MNLAPLVSENYPLLVLPAAAAAVGWLLGRLLRGPQRKQPLEVVRTRDFIIAQKAGVVRGRKIVLSSRDTHQPVEEIYEMHVPSNMPPEQREDSLRQAAAT